MENTPAELVLSFCLNPNTQNIIHETVFELSKLKFYLINLLQNSNTEIHIPNEDSGPLAISQYPKDPEEEVLDYLEEFLQLSRERCLYLLNGHCETCAVLLTQKLLQSIRNSHNFSATEVLLRSYADLGTELSARTPLTKRVELIFRAEAIGLQKQGKVFDERRLCETWETDSSCAKPANMWKSTGAKINDEDSLKTYLLKYLAGSKAFAVNLKELADKLTKDDPVVTIPMYIAGYIWDSKNYELHVVGLVLHLISPVLHVYFCDPNGYLIPGGSVEPLSLPFELLHEDVMSFSANMSRHERDKSSSSSKKSSSSSKSNRSRSSRSSSSSSSSSSSISSTNKSKKTKVRDMVVLKHD